MSLSIDIPPPPDSPPLPYYEQSVLIDWATRKDFNTSLEELEMDEEVERLRMLREIVCGIQKALGPLWERKIPPTSLLIPLLRRPYPYAISKQISDCGQCFLTKRLHVGKFWLEIYHSVWFPLIFERFNIFYTDFQSSSVYGWDPAVGITAWIYFTRNLPPLFRLANYLMTGALESRVAGLHRLLFRMNALEFFSYRISWSLHFNTYDSKAYDAPKEEELGRKDGSLDPVQMTRLATRLLRRLLKNSTACGAIRYNIEAIGLLWPYLIECREEDTLPTDKREGEEDEEKEHEEEVESVGKSTRVGKRPCLTKEEICRRIFTSPLTNAFFSVLADKQVPESPQAVHLIHAYFRLLTEFLYGARPAGFFEDLAASFHLPKGIPCIWTQLENAFHSDMTIFLLRDLLTFITDLLFLICGDEAPLPARNARHLRNKLEGVVLPLVKERRPDLANQETWDLVEENATCLRDAINTALRGGAIDPRLLKHFILPYRCKTGKASSPLRPPELRQTPWPSIMNLIPLPNSIPCWKPGCTKAFVLSEENSLDEKGQDYRYCEGCNVAAYCSKQCQVAHWLADHHRVCPYFRLPPTFMRFEMSAKKVPNSLAFPVFDIFKDTFDIYGPPCGKTTDNFSLIF
ncbi:mynd finger domain-containing protein [Cystoisospora suis]|uniref:Mynd finger domain-containing protein n=1 Tax=Cystoisospora suis TaxID=483139 RepID=A0A2C6LGQ9_9APIC|nr:mynd finger domain-containing protein [Cystoisospora suis]